MKSIFTLAKNEAANVSVGMIIGGLVSILVVTALVPTVASNVATAENNTNLDTGEQALVGLMLLAFILVPVVAIFSRVKSRG